MGLMKLQLENQYSFQKAMGYGDDPEPMELRHIKEQIAFWAGQLQIDIDDGVVSSGYAGLESFLFELSRGEVSFSNPLREFRYDVEYSAQTSFTVCAGTQEEADELASKFYYDHDSELRAKAGDDVRNSWLCRDGKTVCKNY